MEKKKQERDAKGRFVKKKPLKDECENPIRTDSLIKRIEELENELEETKSKHWKETCENNVSFSIVLGVQKRITRTIIDELNLFQRRRLRKILSQYPDEVRGYYIIKDV